MYDCPDHNNHPKIHCINAKPWWDSVFLNAFRSPSRARGWTLQECLLSARILSYGTKLIWYCRNTRHCDGGSEDWSFDELGDELLSISAHTSRTGPRKRFQMSSHETSSTKPGRKSSRSTPEESSLFLGQSLDFRAIHIWLGFGKKISRPSSCG